MGLSIWQEILGRANLAISIINRQTNQLYKDITGMLKLFPRR